MYFCASRRTQNKKKRFLLALKSKTVLKMVDSFRFFSLVLKYYTTLKISILKINNISYMTLKFLDIGEKSAKSDRNINDFCCFVEI